MMINDPIKIQFQYNEKENRGRQTSHLTGIVLVHEVLVREDVLEWDVLQLGGDVSGQAHRTLLVLQTEL